ncbi:hypothetical protein GT347_00990 [Xylophilus rhododendri]|uniref:Uncharacterized protein n=1 Tax=Xylophilus rhododendri TaxID=2697032 RepID=A0A857J0H6_9BURK|nr:hypothetical protein [Xylophilus rhododendri]QHI96689.1 hypothetical protein GT347_00990 [Xylophilus rhododendri]
MFQHEIPDSLPSAGLTSRPQQQDEADGGRTRSPSPPPAPLGPLAELLEFPPTRDSLAVVRTYYADYMKVSGFDQARASAECGRRLNQWLKHSPMLDEEAPAEATAHRIGEELRSALAAALAIGLAHSAELLMVALSNHPAVRLSAMSHPYIVGTYLESLFKELFDVQDPDPENRTGIRFQEKVTAALVNWNYVQVQLDRLPKSALSRSLKVMATASISALRDVAERGATQLALAELPEDAPPGQRKLTSAETFFVNCLMGWLRNAIGDLPRQVIKSQESGALPPADRLVERLLRPMIAGPSAAGGLPAATICVQPLFAEAVREQDDEEPPSPPGLINLAYGPDCNPFSS